MSGKWDSIVDMLFGNKFLFGDVIAKKVRIVVGRFFSRETFKNNFFFLFERNSQEQFIFWLLCETFGRRN